MRTSDGATILLKAPGGKYDTGYQTRTAPQLPPDGFIADNAFVLNGYKVSGASGYTDTGGGGDDEESIGASGFWGNAPAPGGGGAGDRNFLARPSEKNPNRGAARPSNGLVLFEWS